MTLQDQGARETIAQQTDRTLFVQAGAGSGKTSALVDRVTALVMDDGIRLENIAAVTFTEKAGAELRDRLRARFEAVLHDDARPQDVRDHAGEALDDLDGAAIGTLHSFAQRILSEHPIEAGLPPLLEVLDEVGSSVAFEERWSGLQAELLDADEIARPLLLGMAAGITLKHLRSIAHLLGSDWDLIEDRILIGPDERVVEPDVSYLADQAHRIAAQAADCTDPDDRLLAKLAQVGEFATMLAAAPDPETQLSVLRGIDGWRFGVGRKQNWPDKARLVAECESLVQEAGQVVGRVVDVCLRRLTRFIARRVRDEALARAAEGQLEFHDLLVLARDLLRRDDSVRDALQHKYTRLLLDEFQDTDPIQVELAVRIAGGADAGAERWQDVAVPAGRVFLVGDPKQSIYRFRRASIATYLEAGGHLGESVTMTTNFRSAEPVVDWINRVFGQLISYEPDGQPEYVPLTPHRPEPPSGPAVAVVGATAHEDKPKADELRTREAGDVAAVVGRALAEQWPVFDKQIRQWRPARRDDIAILVPARTSLPFLEESLDDAGVPYRAEASSLVYQAQEVRDLFACARAVADTTDALSLVTALRSPLFGCGDDDLWRWKRAGGAFSVFAPVDGPLGDGPVGTALAYLKRLHFDARWMAPSEVLGTIIADRRMFEVAATGPRARDSWRRLRFVVDQARAWTEVSHGGLRAYLAWAAHQGEETSRAAEAVLPETDADAVRIMTIHAAKGLEFPIVILSGMSSQYRGANGVRILWPPDGGYEVKLTSGVQTGDFDAVQPIDEQMDHLERRRLLYVAATRARDHLVVSLHRVDGSTSVTNARLLADAGAGSGVVDLSDLAPVAGGLVDGRRTVSPPPDFAQWRAGMEAARSAARHVPAVSASGLEGTEPEVALAPAPEQATDAPVADGSAKGARDVELPPWTKGRYGSAVGRAVHGVLQVVDLATGAGLDDTVAAQCLAEGVTEHAALVRDLVRSALDSETVQRAASRPHWRESYVGTVTDDGTVLEGFVDLIYRDDDGTLVIVDYKTDAVPEAGLASRDAFYRPQMEAYARALRAANGQDVRAELLYLAPGAALARAIS